MAKLTKEKRGFWGAMRVIFRLLATEDTQKIIQQLLKNKRLGSTELMKKAGLTESHFHPIMRQLVKYTVVEKIAIGDRGISYSLSPFGIHVLKLSKPLLQEVKTKITKEVLA